MILLEKLYKIMLNNYKPKKRNEKKSLNYPSRKKEIGRINHENRTIFKSLIEVKPSVDMKKIHKWNATMERYKRNISYDHRRTTPYQPIRTAGLAHAFPEFKSRVGTTQGRSRKLSAEIPAIDHFINLVNADFD
jgi:hypothetical protein